MRLENLRHVCHCLRRFTILFHEAYRYFDKNWSKMVKIRKFSKFCLFRCHFRTVFVWKTAFISFLSILDNTYFPCWPFSTFQLTKSVKNWKKMHEIFENWKLLEFLSFSVSMWDFFQIKNRHYLFGNAYWTTNLYHVDRFQHSSPRIRSKIWQKLHKNVKNLEIFGFLCHFWVFFFPKNRICLFINDHWTTSFCLCESFQHSNPRHLSETRQKLH